MCKDEFFYCSAFLCPCGYELRRYNKDFVVVCLCQYTDYFQLCTRKKKLPISYDVVCVVQGSVHGCHVNLEKRFIGPDREDEPVACALLA